MINRIISILYKIYAATNRLVDNSRNIFSQLSCRAHFLQPRYRQHIMFPRYAIYGKVTVLNLGWRSYTDYQSKRFVDQRFKKLGKYILR